MAIVLFGATGYTGRLTAHALVAAGARPVLAGRDRHRLTALAGELGGLDTVVADADRPDGSVARLLEPGDVLATTVGPFAQRGGPALAAAVEAGATYLDLAAEPAFLRVVFERFGSRAAGRCALVPACGFDHVAGNLAGALALREVGEEARRVDVAALVGGGALVRVSSGTVASIAGMFGAGSFAYRGGRIVPERPAAEVRSFTVDGHARAALSLGSSEHYTLPQLAPSLTDVVVYLGVLSPLSLVMRAAPVLSAAVAAVPGAPAALRSLAAALARRTGSGPSPGARRSGRSRVVAVASDADGERLARVELAGPGPYTFTARMLAWCAVRAASAGVSGTGALGPVQAFGLEALEAGCAAAGLARAS